MSLTVTQAIEIANKRTERRAENELDLRAEFWMAMQELYLEMRFPWRRMATTFTTVPNQQKYDLSAQNLDNIPGAPSVGVAPYFYEMIFCGRAQSPPDMAEVQPLFSELQQAAALLPGTQPAPPSNYFFQQQGANFQRLFFANPCDGVYTIFISFWASIDPNVDDEEEDIPLMPPQGHYAAPVALERAILRFLYGEEDPRYETCDKKYMRCVAQLARMKSFTTNRKLSWATSDRGIVAVDASWNPQDDQFLSRSD